MVVGQTIGDTFSFPTYAARDKMDQHQATRCSINPLLPHVQCGKIRYLCRDLDPMSCHVLLFLVKTRQGVYERYYRAVSLPGL
jgi:hypothetical protein